MTRRVFYDFEFLDTGTTIHPLSLGMVDHQGVTYEAVFWDAPWGEVATHPWLMEHVVPHLPVKVTRGKGMGDLFAPRSLTPYVTDPRVKPGWVIANEVREFITGGGDPIPVELWGDHPHYDHVALAQLWGTMAGLPEGVPMRTHCVAQEADRLGVDVPEQAEQVHDALADAKHVRTVHEYLTREATP